MRGSFLFFDVGVAADPANDLAVRVAHRYPAHQVPAVCAIVAADAELGFILLAMRDRCVPGGLHHGDVVVVNDAAPAVPIELSCLRAGVCVHLLVEPVELSIGGRRPDVV